MSSSNSDSSLPYWEAYTVEELEEALEGLDRQKYPERLPLIQRLLEQRRKQPFQHDELPHPDWEDRPDWSHYSLDELRQALEGLDRDRYPDRETTLKALIEGKKTKEARQDPSSAVN